MKLFKMFFNKLLTKNTIIAKNVGIKWAQTRKIIKL